MIEPATPHQHRPWAGMTGGSCVGQRKGAVTPEVAAHANRSGCGGVKPEVNRLLVFPHRRHRTSSILSRQTTAWLKRGLSQQPLEKLGERVRGAALFRDRFKLLDQEALHYGVDGVSEGTSIQILAD